MLCISQEPCSKGLQLVKKYSNVFKHAINFWQKSKVYTHFEHVLRLKALL